MTRPGAQDRGVALLNALLLVAAISAVAAGLMLRAETSRTRVEHLQVSQQAALHLDAAEWLIDPVLRGDWERDQNLDHLLEGWSLAGFEADIDRAQMTGTITDLQGRYNINSLSDPSDINAVQSFDRLLASLGLPLTLGREIAGFIQARGPAQTAEYASRPLPILPAGAPLDRIEELRLVNGMTAEAYARLLPYVAALPPGGGLNVNTTSPEVLGAMLPGTNPAGIALLIAERGRVPFADREDFTTRAETLLHPRVITQSLAPDGGFVTASDWFEARFDVRLDGRIQSRILTVERSTLTGAVTLRHRRTVTQ
ncbi:Type II secretory pathway, component PulK [Roseovarius mucosus DSM 17069]|uniref:Type II secretion system protein K n=1 Tax=Roseovarius mucosus DSM 17069 TaxID=1288298 RepID=A0A0A0HEU6_9RHOB|nr:type II secretion system minor pseudopilin GspK [Roseovarius mucosus]KGM86242.1 Type II secretory pathway, component PulK [Roseovarius mucosus DSM 17069]